MRIFLNLIVVLICVSLLPACGGGIKPYNPTSPTEPEPKPELTTIVSGRVFNALNGNPIAGATVEVVDTDLKTTTDNEGLYKIEGIKVTTFTVRYSYLDYTSAVRNFTQMIGNNLTDVNVGLTPPAPTTIIGGRVFNALNNNPIADATVEVVGTELKTVTDSEGRYKIEGIKTTSFTVRFTYLTYQPEMRNFTLQLGTERTDVNVSLKPTTSISGIVYGGSVFSAVLVPKATVEVISPATDAGLKTTTDSQGFYRLAGIKSTSFTVRYSHPNWDSRNADWTLQLGTEGTTQNIILRPR